MKKHNIVILCGISAILSGCASGIVQMSEDTYYMADTGLF